MEKVRSLLDEFSYCYVMDCQNFRNPLMKEVKQQWKESRIFQGKVAPTIVSLGKTKDDEYRTNSHLISNALQNKTKGAHKGLFFTNEKPDKVISWFSNHKVVTFAKAGFVCTRDFIVKKGILKQFVFSQEVTLRQLGLPVILKEGRLILKDDNVVCQRGQPLRPEQGKLLELFNEPQAQFSITLHGYWTNNEFFEMNNNENDNNNDNKIDNNHVNNIDNNHNGDNDNVIDNNHNGDDDNVNDNNNDDNANDNGDINIINDHVDNNNNTTDINHIKNENEMKINNSICDDFLLD